MKTLLLSFAVSDLSVGLLAQPLYIVKTVNPTCSAFRCKFQVQIKLSFASFLGIVAISIDRFLAIHLHLRYQELVTHKLVVAVVISIWTLNLLFPILIFNLNFKTPVFVIMFLIFGFCVIISGIVYSRMFFTASHHANQIQVLQIQLAQNNQIESADGKRNLASVCSTYILCFWFAICHNIAFELSI